MTPPKISEDNVLRRVSEELSRTRVLSESQRQALSKVFEKRLPQALALVEEKKVESYRFSPSGKTVWVVRGRKGDYQVMPESMFCTCDDYYFRVMDNKRQLCYHLVAQQIAQALGQFVMLELPDSRYAEIASRWATSAHPGRS